MYRYSLAVLIALCGALQCAETWAQAISITPSQCTLTVGSAYPCPMPLRDADLGGTHKYSSAVSTPGPAAGPIDVWGYCRYIDNITVLAANPESSLVPFRSAEEWLAFINNAPADTFAVYHCARPAMIYVPADTKPGDFYYDPAAGNPHACTNATPPLQVLVLPYGKQGETLTQSIAFLCRESTGQEWTKTATVKFLALDSDNPANNPSWRMVNITYSGAPPAP
ncbi:MAG: hypothetical protein AB7H77_11085 [Bdellovibrionales bacterium]